MAFEEKDEHESFGNIMISRTHNTPEVVLFGSPMKHRETITLRIATSVRYRELNRNWYHAGKELIEISMSQAQFAEMITSMNQGGGVPCTLTYVNGKRLDSPPEIDERLLFEKEFESKLHRVSEKAVELAEQAKELLEQKTLKKADREEIVSLINRLVQDVRSNIPFVQSSFNESMENVVAEAKGEVEAYITGKLREIGVEQTQRLGEMPRVGGLLESKVVKDEE